MWYYITCYQNVLRTLYLSIRESPPQFENRIMAWVYVRSISRSAIYQKAPILLAGTGVSLACGFSSIKIDYPDYPKSLISRINEVYVFFKKISLYHNKHKLDLSRMFCCNHTSYCVNMVSVTSASGYTTLASCYHPRYQIRSSMFIRSLNPRNFAELAEAVPIVYLS